MWNRACPICFAKVPRSLVLTRSEDLVCPSCHTPLELSRPSQVLAAVIGLAAGFLPVYMAAKPNTGIKWALPIVAGVVLYGIASALALFFVADLVTQPKAPGGHFPQAPK